MVPIYDMIMLDSTAEIAPMEDGFSWCRGDAELGMVLEVFHNQLLLVLLQQAFLVCHQE